jgi:hypothetical protein
VLEKLIGGYDTVILIGWWVSLQNEGHQRRARIKIPPSIHTRLVYLRVIFRTFDTKILLQTLRMYTLVSHQILGDHLSNIIVVSWFLYADSIHQPIIILKYDGQALDRYIGLFHLCPDTKMPCTQICVMGILGLGGESWAMTGAMGYCYYMAWVPSMEKVGFLVL